MKASTAQDYRERVVRTLLYIQQHLDEELDYAALSSVAAFSPFHFHRVFRGICGETVTQHIRRLRLERAARDLRDGDRAVTDIAFEAGFEAHESFTRAFAKRFGMPPVTTARSRPSRSSNSRPFACSSFATPDRTIRWARRGDA